MDASGLSDIKDLAKVVHGALYGGAADRCVDRGLAAFAIHRHRVGPLVQMAVAAGRAQADEDAAILLSSEWQNNRRRCALQQISLRRIAGALEAADISFAFFKGLGLAEALYPAPEWRHSGDIDVLITPHAWSRTIEALKAARFAISDPLLALPPALAHLALLVIRDIAIVDSATGRQIEIHSRLLFSPNVGAQLLKADPALGPSIAPGKHSPHIGPGVLCYLLLHGAISGWSRLKWLVDIYAILPKLEPRERAKTVSIAEACGTTLAVRAGLMVARDVFPDIALGELRPWVDDGTGWPRARRRADRYAAWLAAPSDASPNPLHDRRAALTSALLLHDGWQSQLATLSHGGLAAGLRMAGRAMQRAQAAPDAPAG